MTMRKTLTTLIAAALAVLAIAPSAASAGGRDGFHATVLKVAPGGDAVRVQRSSGVKLRVAITPTTKFERIAGVSALRRGLAIEIKATRTANGLVAREIEISGGDDDRGGDDDSSGSGSGGGDDDNSGSGSSGSEPGDDHGSGGHGSDDR